jgi:hypothetical protein
VFGKVAGAENFAKSVSHGNAAKLTAQAVPHANSR